VAQLDRVPLITGVFRTRGATALVFRGDDGLDELTTTTTSTVWEVRGGVVRELTLDPLELGIARARPQELQGGDVTTNVAAARALLAGETGAVRDAVVLNAAAGLAAHAGLTGDLVADLREGAHRASVALDSGAAAELLDNWVTAGQLLSSGH